MTLSDKIYDPARSIYTTLPDILPTVSNEFLQYLKKSSYRSLAKASLKAFDTGNNDIYISIQTELHQRRQPVIKSLRRN